MLGLSARYSASGSTEESSTSRARTLYLTSSEDKVRKHSRSGRPNIRARLAKMSGSIPGKSAGTIQIIGRAAALQQRQDQQDRQTRKVEDVGQLSMQSTNRRNDQQLLLDQTETLSHAGTSRIPSNAAPVSTTPKRRSVVSTKVSLGNHYPPLEPTLPRGRERLPSQPVVSQPSMTGEQTRSSSLHHTASSSSPVPSQHSTAQRFSEATFDPFGDEEDEHVMRRLASPVLRPNYSAGSVSLDSILVSSTIPLKQAESTRSSFSSVSQQRSNRLAVTPGPKLESVVKQEASVSSASGRHEITTASSNGREICGSVSVNSSATSSGPSTSAAPDLDSYRPNQQVNHTLIHEQTYTNMLVDIGEQQTDHVAPSSMSVFDASLAAATHSTPLQHRTAQAPVQGTTINASLKQVKKHMTLDDHVALLESLLSDLAPPEPSRSVVEAISPDSPAAVSVPANPTHVPYSARAAALPTFLGRDASPLRRSSSASSESYEPASRSSSPEMADFAPGEFVTSNDVVDTSASLMAANDEGEISARTLPVARKEKKLPEDSRKEATFLPSRLELPPNSSIPPASSIRSASHSPHPVLVHPKPIRSPNMPTASRLEEEVASPGRKVAMDISEPDMTVEYEEVPVDIAARSIRRKSGSGNTVKFVDAKEDFDDEEVEERKVASSAPEHSYYDDEADEDSDDDSYVETPHEEKASTTGIEKTPRNLEDTTSGRPMEFEFEETDIFKGIKMPDLARRHSHASSESSDSNSQPSRPVSPAVPKQSRSSVKQEVQSKTTAMSTHAPSAESSPRTSHVATAPLGAHVNASSKPTDNSASPPTADKRPASPASSHGSKSESSEDEDSRRSNPAALLKVTSPAIGWGRSLNKKEQRQRTFGLGRLGVHAGYAGPQRTFRTFKPNASASRTSDEGRADSDAGDVPSVPSAKVQPAHRDDDEDEVTGNISLATFEKNYEDPIQALARLLGDVSTPNSQTRDAVKSPGRAKPVKQPVKSELDIFDGLL